MLFNNSCQFTKNEIKSDKVIYITKENTDSLNSKYNAFNLWYSYSGLGSNYGSLQPVFRVKGPHYVYSFEQNSTLIGIYDKKPKYHFSGELRLASIDSILDLVKNLKDTIVDKWDSYIMSGGVHSIKVEFNEINVEFHLRNAHDSTAQKIVDILNSNIPIFKKRLWLFHDLSNTRK